MARDKCPNLVVAEPDYALYVASSRRLMALLRGVSPVVEQYSIDEAWVDMTGMAGLYGPPVLAAQHLKDRIFRTLGFTVNIGVSCNKLLAKMAGELEKPDKVITLFPQELSRKLWPLPVGELFMVGRATTPKLQAMGIRTIGDLAKGLPCFYTVLCRRCAFGQHDARAEVFVVCNDRRNIPQVGASSLDERSVRSGPGQKRTVHVNVEPDGLCHQ